MNPIESLRQKRGQVFAKFEKFGDIDRALTTEEEKEFGDLKAEMSALDAQITRAEEVRAMKAASATPINQGTQAQASSVQVSEPKREKGWALSRIVRSLAACKGDWNRAAAYCEKVYGDQQVAKALAAGSATAGGFIVPEDFSAEIIEFLRPMSVVRASGAVTVPLPNGNMTMPKQAGGASAAYLGENQNLAKTEQTFGQLRLTARKLGALTPISNDLIRFASTSVDTLVRNDLVAAIAQAEDSAFIRNDGTGAAPKGLRYWCPSANALAVNATVNLANIDQDLGRAWLALREANSRMLNLGWLMAPRSENYLRNIRDGNGNKAFPEMANGTLKGYPFKSTTQIPTNLAVTGSSESEIYLVDFADVIIGEVPGIIIDVSDTAAYHDGSNVVAAFSLDQTVVRVITQHDLGMRHDSSIAVLKDVDWA